ncbi:MAG: hypothetical protein K2X90_04440 [Candidatus Babeliaceae bacterium]|nr:hypothetical protein [Candidatus Babeliaceae bacterium]
MDFKRQLLLLTCMFAVANLAAQDSADEAETKGKNKKYDCLTVRNHFFDCGDAVITGLLTANGGLVVNGDETIAGDVTITGDVNVTGTICAGGFDLCPAAATGTPGVPGIGGDLAYGYEYNVGAATVAANTAVSFSNQDLSSGITLAADSMTATNSGIYRVQFEVRGFDSTNPNTFPLKFSLQNNGSDFASFASDTLTSGTAVVNGAAMVTLAAGDVITLVNVNSI